jgi:cytochrome c-type biogenesis protein CcmH
MKSAAWILCAALLAPLAWAADQPQQQAVDPDRFYQLTSQLRCLVCQNESLADSNADLAIDLKNEIRARMASGQSDAQIKKFLVDRYGNFVIYRPPFDATTLLLWLGPLLLAAGGLFAVWRSMRAASAHGAAEPDEPDESDELNQPRRKESAP